MSPRRNKDSPNPSLASECAPPPRPGGGGHTRLQVRGWGSPNFDDWSKSLALCLLCARGSQRDAVYLGWPIPPSYMSPNAGGVVAGSQPTWVQLCTWSPNKHWRSNSIFNLWLTPTQSLGQRRNQFNQFTRYLLVHSVNGTFAINGKSTKQRL